MASFKGCLKGTHSGTLLGFILQGFTGSFKGGFPGIPLGVPLTVPRSGRAELLHGRQPFKLVQASWFCKGFARDFSGTIYTGLLGFCAVVMVL